MSDVKEVTLKEGEIVVPLDKDKNKTDADNNINLSTLASDSLGTLLKKMEVSNIGKAAEYTDTLKNRLYVIGDIDEDTGDAIDSFIRYWNTYDEECEIPVENRVPIKICINSNGGNFLSTLTGFDAIKNSKTPVWTINVGKAYSGGLFLMCAGHKRFAYKYSSFLFHEGSTALSGADANKFQNYADFYKTLRTKIKEIVLENTKITEEEYDSHIKDDWWLMSDEALKYGIIDEIVTGNWYC